MYDYYDYEPAYYAIEPEPCETCEEEVCKYIDKSYCDQWMDWHDYIEKQWKARW